MALITQKTIQDLPKAAQPVPGTLSWQGDPGVTRGACREAPSIGVDGVGSQAAKARYGTAGDSPTSGLTPPGSVEEDPTEVALEASLQQGLEDLRHIFQDMDTPTKPEEDHAGTEAGELGTATQLDDGSAPVAPLSMDTVRSEEEDAMGANAVPSDSTLPPFFASDEEQGDMAPESEALEEQGVFGSEAHWQSS